MDDISLYSKLFNGSTLHIFTLHKGYRDFKIINFTSIFSAKNKVLGWLGGIIRRVVFTNNGYVYPKTWGHTGIGHVTSIHFKASLTLHT